MDYSAPAWDDTSSNFEEEVMKRLPGSASKPFNRKLETKDMSPIVHDLARHGPKEYAASEDSDSSSHRQPLMRRQQPLRHQQDPQATSQIQQQLQELYHQQMLTQQRQEQLQQQLYQQQHQQQQAQLAQQQAPPHSLSEPIAQVPQPLLPPMGPSFAQTPSNRPKPAPVPPAPVPMPVQQNPEFEEKEEQLYIRQEHRRPVQQQQQQHEQIEQPSRYHSSRRHYSSSSFVSGDGTRDKERTERDKERDKDNELFLCREFFLSTSERIKAMTELTSRVEEHVKNDCNLDLTALKSILSQSSRYPTSLPGARKLNDAMPKEAYIVEAHCAELDDSTQSLLGAIAECMGVRNATYLAQLRKLREVGNAATRNAVQSERAEAFAALQRVRGDHEQQIEALNSDIRKLNDAHSAERSAFRCRELELSNEVSRLEAMLSASDSEKERAVQSAIRAMNADLEEQRSATASFKAGEAHRVREAVSREVDALRVMMEAQASKDFKHEEEIRALLGREKERAEAELVKVRDQLMHTLAQFSAEKEVSAARITEARALGEREAQEARAEALRLQSNLKAELATVIQRARAEDAARISEFEVVLVKDRETQATAYALENERMIERHRTELRRQQANLEVRHQEEVARMKHVHEAEVKRLIRESDRLQRTLARSGPGAWDAAGSDGAGSDGFYTREGAVLQRSPARDRIGTSVSRTTSSASPSRSPARMHTPHKNDATTAEPDDNDDHAHATSTLRGSIEAEPLPPPPPPQPAALDWGELKRSITAQESSSSVLPTRVSFPISSSQLDAAMSKSAASTRDNTRRVGSYMAKLQTYLEGIDPPNMSGQHDADEDGSIEEDSFDEADADDGAISLDQLARNGRY